MISINIILDKLSMPKPKRCMPMERKVRHCLERLEHEDEEVSRPAWDKLKMYYELLTSKKYNGPDRDKLLKLITPAISKYAQYDNDGVELSTEYLSEG